MIILSLRVFEKQSPDLCGGYFATCARNDMLGMVNALRAVLTIGSSWSLSKL